MALRDDNQSAVNHGGKSEVEAQAEAAEPGNVEALAMMAQLSKGVAQCLLYGRIDRCPMLRINGRRRRKVMVEEEG